MADKLTQYSVNSLNKYLQDNSGISSVVTITADFDYDYKTVVTDVARKVRRDLPFITIQLIGEDDKAFSISDNILTERTLDIAIGVYSTSWSNLTTQTGSMKQALLSAVHPVSAKRGIPLYDFATPSGTYYDIVGTMAMEMGTTEYFGPESQGEEDNRKFSSITTLNLSGFKDYTATLLENKGRIGLTNG